MIDFASDEELTGKTAETDLAEGVAHARLALRKRWQEL